MPLNALGRSQAEAAGRSLVKLLRRRGASEVEARDFVCSPLSRARETMEIARGAAGLPAKSYRLDDRLRELGFGDWEGLTWPDVKLREPDRYRTRKAGKWAFLPPGDSESYAVLAERLRPWLATIVPLSVVVAHGGVARALMVLIGGVDPLVAPDVDIWQGRVLRFVAGRFRWD